MSIRNVLYDRAFFMRVLARSKRSHFTSLQKHYRLKSDQNFPPSYLSHALSRLLFHQQDIFKIQGAGLARIYWENEKSQCKTRPRVYIGKTRNRNAKPAPAYILGKREIAMQNPPPRIYWENEKSQCKTRPFYPALSTQDSALLKTIHNFLHTFP
jgi:hypothetical protein